MAAHPVALAPFEHVRRARRTIRRYELPCRLAIEPAAVRLAPIAP